MANEGRISATLAIRKLSADGSKVLMDFRRTASFAVTVSGTKGPVPGSFSVGIGGKIVNLEELGTPGLCWLTNMDATNYVTLGIWDPGIDVYYPMLEIGPGESYPVKLYRHIQEEFTQTGTGTTGPGNYLFAKAVGGTVVINVEACDQ